MDEQFSPITDILNSPAFQSFTSESSETEPDPPQITPQADTHIIAEHLLDLRARIDAILALLNTHTHHIAAHTTDFDTIEPQNGTIIEGVFDGQQMIDADGKQYHIPPNYASKSKLVEGDMMKLTITSCGAYVYKQIAATPRQRLIGTIVYDEQTRTYGANAENKLYKILKASVTFYKLTPGTRATILIPQNSPSHWAAIDNIMQQ